MNNQSRCSRRPQCVLTASIFLLAAATKVERVRAGEIYWAQSFGDRIERANSDGSNQETLLSWPELDDATAIAVDTINGKLYWAQTFGDRILRANLDGSGVETLLEWPELDDPVGIALDVGGGKIYWAQKFGDRIMRANLNGTNAEILLEWPELDDAVGLALDLSAGKIYWAQTFGDRIMRANLNGSSAEILLEWPELDDPTAIALDVAGGKVYWAQLFGDRIMRADLSGANSQILLEWPELDDAVALALDVTGGKMYWAQSFGDRIIRADLNGGSVETLLSWPELDDATCLAFAGTSSPAAVEKNRYVSVQPIPRGQATALRVKLTSLLHPDPPNLPQFPSANFGAFEGQVRWVGAPANCIESESPPSTFKCSLLQCSPHYRDWATALGGGQLQITGSAIVPSSAYDIDELASSCQGNEAACTSVLSTVRVRTARFGDIVAPFQASAPSPLTQPNVIDVTAVVDKFKGLPTAPPKARTQLHPNVPDINRTVDIVDIANTIDGFKGFAYPYAGPTTCQ